MSHKVTETVEQGIMTRRVGGRKEQRKTLFVILAVDRIEKERLYDEWGGIRMTVTVHVKVGITTFGL